MKNISNIFFSIILLLLCVSTSAETQFDRSLIQAGVIDKNYKIIDKKAFDVMMRHITNEISGTLPRRIDNENILLSVVMSQYVIAHTYTIDIPNPKQEFNTVTDKPKFEKWIRNFICASALGRSMVYRENGTEFLVKIVDEELIEFYSYSFPMKKCGDIKIS